MLAGNRVLADCSVVPIFMNQLTTGRQSGCKWANTTIALLVGSVCPRRDQTR